MMGSSGNMVAKNSIKREPKQGKIGHKYPSGNLLHFLIRIYDFDPIKGSKFYE
jgi:hypothetical protein